MTEDGHAPRKPSVVPQVPRDPPHVHVVVHAVRRQHDAVPQIRDEDDDPRRDEHGERDGAPGDAIGATRLVVGRRGRRPHVGGSDQAVFALQGA